MTKDFQTVGQMLSRHQEDPRLRFPLFTPTSWHLRGPQILKSIIGHTKLTLKHILGAKQTVALGTFWWSSSNETVTVAHNRAFLVFCGSTVLSAWLSKAVQVQLTMTVWEGYENNRFLKTSGFRQIVDVTHSDVAKCWKLQFFFASLFYCQAFERLHLTYWNVI